MSKRIVVVDFETEAIDDTKNAAPKPVGVSIMFPDSGESKYWAFGHPVENNCTESQARRALTAVWGGKYLVIFHNAKFDQSVAHEHWGLRMLNHDEYDDTMFLLFLHNPHAMSLSLKPSADALLGMPPEEQDAVKQWLLAHGFIKTLKQKDAGAFICKAPGKLVGDYANGDVLRTWKLYELIYPTLDEGMRTAYERELRLMPILYRNEREGMLVDVDRLARDVTVYQKSLGASEDWLRKRLGNDSINFDADAEVAAALDANELVTDWVMTPKSGKKSVAKKNLTIDKILDPQVAAALGYRNRLITVLKMSMEPWLAQAQATGSIFTSWNQVRQAQEGHGANASKGTRTGRLSCSRFMNISKDFMDKGDGYIHPAFLGIPELPLVRKYIIPDKGGVFMHRDYNQQEFRIFAHFEDGKMCAAYRTNPRMDFHIFVQGEIERVTGQSLQRRPVKILNFGMLYGMGVGKLAAGTGVDVETARKLRAAQKAAIPDLRQMERDIKERARNNQPLRTWGGRLYFCEPPVLHQGRWLHFDYKLLNYLVQGSAADCTKEAVIRYDAVKKESRFMVTVHDEINASAPKMALRKEMTILNDVMSSIEMSVPMISDGKAGPNWGELTKYEEA
jgi:DNA polymerase I-like protein with 3'-5' exonuclease and polymerase domains